MEVKSCERCGVPLGEVIKTKRYCKECTILVKKENQAARRAPYGVVPCSCMGIKQFSAGKAIRCTAESCKNKSEPSCGSCKWYAKPKGVCVNDQSEHVADFLWDERGCKEWEKKDERK